MRNQIIDSFFKSNKREDISKDENNTYLLLHILSSIILNILLLNYSHFLKFK